jgi:hypothetical protein
MRSLDVTAAIIAQACFFQFDLIKVGRGGCHEFQQIKPIKDNDGHLFFGASSPARLYKLFPKSPSSTQGRGKIRSASARGPGAPGE